MTEEWNKTLFNFYLAGVFDTKGKIVYYKKKYVIIKIYGLDKKIRDYIKENLGFGHVFSPKSFFFVSRRIDCLRFLKRIENKLISKREEVKECILFLEKILF